MNAKAKPGVSPPMIQNPVPWPNKARVAATFTWDLDADSILHNAHPDDSHTRIAAASHLRYGPDIAVRRVCNLFEHYGISVTFCVPGWCFEEHPHAIERMLDGGHEIAHHGYMHEFNNMNTRDRELYWMTRASENVERFTGKKPRGFRAPWLAFSPHTAEIMTEMGFIYDSSLMGDDVPYVIRSRSGGELIEIPVHWPIDDWIHYGFEPNLDFMVPIRAPARAKEVYMSEYDAMHEDGGLWVANFHPFVSGRNARLKAIEKMIQEMQERGGVWFATMEEIAVHTRKMIDAGKHDPRVVDVPYKQNKIGELAENAIPLRG